MKANPEMTIGLTSEWIMEAIRRLHKKDATLPDDAIYLRSEIDRLTGTVIVHVRSEEWPDKPEGAIPVCHEQLTRWKIGSVLS